MTGVIGALDPPPARLLKLAEAAVECAAARGDLPTPWAGAVMTIIDYQRPSDQPRLWVIDRQTGQVLYHVHVSHGTGSGERRARAFSNTEGSHQSSLGLFRTAEVYEGKNGYSLRLDGLEPGVNDAARDRLIVFHGAAYASPSIITETGRLGRSWGCPALDLVVTGAVLDTIKEGTPVFAWYPDHQWLKTSSYLHCT